VITGRGKLILWLSILPLVYFAGSLAWLRFMVSTSTFGAGSTPLSLSPSTFLSSDGSASRWHFWILGLVSLWFDRRINETK